jgi:hypothetical protein
MPPEPATRTWIPDSDEVARTILDIILRQHPSLVAIEDLTRELCHPSLLQQIDGSSIHDGLLDLTCCGLIHRLDNYVFATRAVLRSRELIC